MVWIGYRRIGERSVVLGFALGIASATGCSDRLIGTRDPEFAATVPIMLASANTQPTPAIQSAAYLRPNAEPAEGKPEDKLKITLPAAVAMCVNANFRILAAAQHRRLAEGDLVTASLIPNPTLLADGQLIPLQKADFDNQLGPTQYDANLSIPVDWLLFGKRLAAVDAARLGLEVSNADYADTIRLQVARTVDAFYEVLEDDAYFKASEKYLKDLEDLEALTADLAKEKKVGPLEVDRAKLAVHEALLERHDRELALDLAKAKLRPLLGRTAADPDYDVDGSLTVTAVVPPPKLAEAMALADTHRPDVLSGRQAIAQANAFAELERRRGKPVVSIEPGYTYQDQKHSNNFRNGSLVNLGISTTLPFTDRNQGNVLKARAAAAERQAGFQADRADALAEVEAAVASYDDAVEHLTQFNTKETLQAAASLRKEMEAAYRRGDRRLLERLDAERSYRDRLGHVIEFEAFYWRSLNRLNAAVGLNAYDPQKGATRPVTEKAEGK